MKKRGYESALDKQLKIIDGACNEIAAISLKNDMHPQHIKDINELISNRTRRLKKQLDTKEDDYEMTLSVVDDDEEPSSSKKDDKKTDSSPSSSSSEKEVARTGFEGSKSSGLG